MRVVVFGANGNIGSRVVALLLEEGHQVRAFVHNSSKLLDHPQLTTTTGDVHNLDDVRRAIRGVDAVISTLGSWGTKNKDILTAGIKNIIPAMEEASVKRIVSLTGSGVLLPSDKLKLYDYLNPLLLKIVAPKILSDGKRHIELLEKSALDWTVVRSPVMKNGAPKGYSFQNCPPLLWHRISREDVAESIVQLLGSGTEIKQSPFIA